MCQYSYTYYGGCQHQELVLHAFCPCALPLPADGKNSSDSPPVPAKRLHDQSSVESRAPSSNATSAPSTHGLAATGPVTAATRSTRSHSACPGLPSVRPTSSKSQPTAANHTASSFTDTASDLALLSRSQARPISSAPVQSTSQLRRSYSSVASCPAPTETAVETMAAAASSVDYLHFGKNGGLGLHDSVAASDRQEVEKGRQLGSPDGMIDLSTHANVARHETLRAMTDMMAEFEDLKERFESKTHASACDKDEACSAATRLQKIHEQRKQQSRLQSQAGDDRKSSPCTPLDFPQLVSTASEELSRSISTASHEKLSYANMATTGMMEAISQTFNVGNTRPDIRSSIDRTSSASTQSYNIAMALTTPSSSSQVGHNIALSLKADSVLDVTDALDEMPILGNTKPSEVLPTSAESKSASFTVRQPPRFAQPTAAFARKAVGTANKQCELHDHRTGDTGSPAKSKKGTLRAPAKRASLPTTWMQGTTGRGEISPVSSDSPNGIKLQSMTAEKTSHCLVAPRPNPKASSPGRNKLSSFMSPTKATIRKSVATPPRESDKKERTQTVTNKYLPKLNTKFIGSDAVVDLEALTATTISSSVCSSPACIITDLPETIAHPQQRIPRSVVDANGKVPLLPSAFQLGAHFELSPDDHKDRYQLVASKTHAKSYNIGNATRSSPTSAIYANVANTTTVRRKSHGHILKPIKAKLDNLGLLNSRSSSVSLGGVAALDATSDSSSMEVEISSIPSPYPSTNQATRDSVDFDTFIPANMRLRQVTSSSVNTLRPSQMTSENNKPQAPSLRATALEFTPSHVLQQELTRLVQGSALDFQPDDAWSSLSLEVRQSIIELRRFHKQMAGKGKYDQRYGDGDVARGPAQNSAQSPHTSAIDHAMSDYPTLNYDHGKWLAHTFDGKPFTPSFGRAPPPVWPQLGANSVGLPFPGGPTKAASLSSMIPPSSLEVSPSSTLASANSPGSSWSFESPSNNGIAEGIWAGSDGREIAFIGNGVRAERHRRFEKPFRPSHHHREQYHHSSYSPVKSFWQTATSPRKRVHDASVPRLVGMDYEGQISNNAHWGQGFHSPVSPPLAPRSRQQWLEMSRGAKPCVGDVEIISAVEALPFMSSLNKDDAHREQGERFGFCGSCVAFAGGNDL